MYWWNRLCDMKYSMLWCPYTCCCVSIVNISRSNISCHYSEIIMFPCRWISFILILLEWDITNKANSSIQVTVWLTKGLLLLDGVCIFTISNIIIVKDNRQYPNSVWQTFCKNQSFSDNWGCTIYVQDMKIWLYTGVAIIAPCGSNFVDIYASLW